jgi:hypothetical protein
VLAAANEIFSHGERDRFASVAVAIVFRPDFASERWGFWVRELDKEDRTVFEPSPPAVQAEQRFENDSYFLSAAIARISLRPATPAPKTHQKHYKKCFVRVSRHKGGIAGAAFRQDGQSIVNNSAGGQRSCNVTGMPR